MRLFCGCVVISIHALREEGDASGTQRTPPYGQFLSTPSARRATSWASLTGKSQKFLSTPSARRATEATALRPRPPENFYPRPPRGGRRALLQRRRLQYKISIHALREEGDDLLLFRLLVPIISIHALREEGDPHLGFRPVLEILFLSTPSARRATSICARPGLCSAYFYPRPPRGGRP